MDQINDTEEYGLAIELIERLTAYNPYSVSFFGEMLKHLTKAVWDYELTIARAEAAGE